MLQADGVSHQLLLYTTAGCHLCEQAQSLLLPWLEQGISVELVDIAEEDALVERYGIRIPVLAASSGEELGWPFDAVQLAGWLRALPQQQA